MNLMAGIASRDDRKAVEADLLVPTVEISDPAAANADEPKREPRLSGISEVEINQLRQQFPQWIDGIQGSVLDADGCFRTPQKGRVG